MTYREASISNTEYNTRIRIRIRTQTQHTESSIRASECCDEQRLQLYLIHKIRLHSDSNVGRLASNGIGIGVGDVGNR